MTAPLKTLRIIPRESDFLDRKSGNAGEIFFDKEDNTLRLYNGIVGGTALAKADLQNVTNATFAAKAAAAGISGGGGGNTTVSVGASTPVSPSNGNLWLNTSNGILYVYINDGNSSQWIQPAVPSTQAQNTDNFITLDQVRFKVAADDSTQVTIAANNTLQIVGGTGIATSIDSDGVLTIASTQSPFEFSTETDDLVLRSVPSSSVFRLLGAGSVSTSTTINGEIIITGSAATTGNISFVGNVIDSADSSAIQFTPAVNFESDVVVGNEIVFADGSRQSTSAVGIPGPQGPQGPAGATGPGSGDVVSAGGSYVDNRIVRYDGATGTIIQVSSASISDAGLLTATSFSGDGSLITALNATELTSGTIPNSRFPATLPAASGTNLTALNATQLTSGTIPDARFPATLPAASGTNLTALNATQLTSGTIPDARFPATLPASSGTNLTALNATQLTSGTVPIGRLGASGTPSSSTYLRGDNSWATVTGGSASNSFETIAVAGQSNVVAASATDTLTLAAGSGINITTNAGTDTVTITSTVSAGASAFTGLTDVTAASLTVDKIYLPAITMLVVTNNGASSYRFDQYGSIDDPTIYAINATTIAFNLQATGHPFLIQDNSGTNYNTGLVHVTTTGVVTTGSSAQGKDSGTLYWKIPDTISGNYRYQCGAHAAMVGTIVVKNFGSI